MTPPPSGGELVELNEATRALAAASTVPDVKVVMDTAEALRVWARRAGCGLEIQNKAAETKIRAERKAGQLLLDMDKHPAGRPPQNRLQAATDLPPTYADLGIEKTAAHRWQRVATVPESYFERYVADRWAMSEEITTAGLLRGGDHRALLSSEGFEWYTPAPYVEAARRTMGGIDLDPASCAQANNIVKAPLFFDKETDGLEHDWPGRVWLNPPYCKAQEAFVAKLLEQYETGITQQAVLLVSAHATSTTWFQPLWDFLLCFTDHRIDFDSPTGPGGRSTHGSAFVYLGGRHHEFAAEFRPFGAVVARFAG